MSTPKTPSLLKQAWHKYKSLRLPWRRQFLVGSDLAGNTFWEFRDALNAGRWRRIMKHAPGLHYGDVRVTAQWHQWLRHTRPTAPTLQEQQYEVSRQEMMKELAAKADERWRSVPSYLDSPTRNQPQPAIGVTDSKPEDPEDPGDSGGAMESVVEDGREQVEKEVGRRPRKREREENPWEKARQQGGPGEKWQPDGWTPGVTQRGGG